jgi:hypothetical protein
MSASFVIEPKIGVPGSLGYLIDRLLEIERRVHPDLSVFRWQTPAPPLPCITNWLGESPFDYRDQMRARDSVVVNARILVSASDDRIDRLTDYADAFRALIDEALYVALPLEGACRRAQRSSMRQFLPQLAEGIVAVGFEFPLLFEVDRIIAPN